MALAYSPEASGQPPQDGTADVRLLRPQQDGVVFLLENTPLPEFPEIGVDSAPVKHRLDIDTKDAKYYDRAVTLSDGTQFNEQYGIAKHPSSDVPISIVPAWLTSLLQGFNKNTSDKLNAAGRHTMKKGIATNRAHGLYRNAYDVHVSLDHAGEAFGDELDTHIIDSTGDSNGAMVGTGVIAYSELFGRIVRDAFLVDPAMVKKLGLPDLAKFVRHPDYIPTEIFCLGKQALRLVRDETENAAEYLKTVEFSTDYWIGNLLLTKSLKSGELGHLAAHIPEDQKLHYYVFDHSIANQKRQLTRIVRGSDGNARPGVTIQTVRGTHLSIANPRTIKAKVDYLTSA